MISLIALLTAQQADITPPATQVPHLLELLRDSRESRRVKAGYKSKVLLPQEIAQLYDEVDLPSNLSNWNASSVWVYIPSRPANIAGMKDVVLIESSEQYWTTFYTSRSSRSAYSGIEKFSLKGKWEFQEVARVDGWNIVGESKRKRPLDEKTTLNLRYLINLAPAAKTTPNFELLLGVLSNSEHRVEIYSDGSFKSDGRWYSPSALEWAQVCRQLKLFK